jgi:hypothetical protein
MEFSWMKSTAGRKGREEFNAEAQTTQRKKGTRGLALHAGIGKMLGGI